MHQSFSSIFLELVLFLLGNFLLNTFNAHSFSREGGRAKTAVKMGCGSSQGTNPDGSSGGGTKVKRKVDESYNLLTINGHTLQKQHFASIESSV